jgi:uncharacterized protein with ParB-like and HNH nuclease domain
MPRSGELEDIFKPESQPILRLFTNSDALYQIPDYQRPYSWTDEQVEQLWEDLKSAFENNQDDINADANYFLGSIITVPGDKGYQDVIDGQQRITTLMILFCVIRDLFPAINEGIDPDQNPNVIKISKIKRCIFDDNDLKRLKFKTAPVNQNDFQETIINAKTNLIKKPSAKSLKTSAKNRFQNTAAIFSEKLTEFSNERNDIIGPFVNYVFNSVKVIKITCTNRSFAIKLFQSLNATGLDLTPTDLLKSFFLSKLKDEESRQFVDDWNRVESISAETDFKDLNEMFVSYEYYMLGSNPKRSLNDELEDLFRDQDPNKVINDIKKFILAYRDEILGSDSTVIFGLRYIRWALYWKTVATSAFKDEYPDRDGLLRELRRFYYLYWIAGKTLTQIKQSSFNVLKWIKEKKDLKFIASELRAKILEDKIEERVRDSLKGPVYNEPWFKPLLLQVEYAQTDASRVSFIEMSVDLHVEHIVPSEFQKHKEWGHISEKDFERYGNSIGNLTLLSGSKNIEASNNPFHLKLDIYRGLGKNKSKKMGLTGFEITKKIVNEHTVDGSISDWTMGDIKKRWNWFCEEVESILEIDLKQNKIKD